MPSQYELINNWFYMSRETRPEGVLQSNVHSHHSYEIFVITDGSTTMLLDDEFISVSRGDIILIRPDILHKNNGGTRHGRYAIHFTERYIGEYFSEKAIEYLIGIFEKNKLNVTDEALDKIISVFRRAEEDEEHAYIHIASVISILYDERNIVTHAPRYADATVNRILEYIRENYAHIRGLDDIAEGLHISKPYMCRSFKKETGGTIADYLNNVRINSACELLRSGNVNVTEAAMLCGYNSPMYFCKVFKRIMNTTPLSYRSALDSGIYFPKKSRI